MDLQDPTGSGALTHLLARVGSKFEYERAADEADGRDEMESKAPPLYAPGAEAGDVCSKEAADHTACNTSSMCVFPPKKPALMQPAIISGTLLCLKADGSIQMAVSPGAAALGFILQQGCPHASDQSLIEALHVPS